MKIALQTRHVHGSVLNSMFPLLWNVTQCARIERAEINRPVHLNYVLVSTSVNYNTTFYLAQLPYRGGFQETWFWDEAFYSL